MSDHYEDDSEDNDFLAWFNRVTDLGTYRLVLPDDIIENLSYADARLDAETAISLAGYESYSTLFDMRHRDVRQIEYLVVDENGKESVFATVEKEGE